MGGSSSRSGKTRIDETLIRQLLNECLEKVHELDESMIGFFKVFDQLTATLRLITDYQSITLTDDKFTPSEAVLLNGTNRKRLTKDVLVCIEKDEENEKLRNSISSLQTDIDNLKSKYLDEWKAEKETLVERTEEKDEQIETLQNKVVELTENVETERKTADDLRKEYEKVKEELENIKCKKVLQVQLFYQRRGGLISEVEENLKEVLKMRLEDGKTELNFISCHSSSDISPDLPTLLIAICASRLGTDAANAIQGLSLHKKILLLIFHHKDVHALPSQASERVLTGQEFKSIGGIYDMAFLSQRGIYSCDLNEKSVTTVVSFLKASKG
ncbi:uncharacterized protein LOC123566549 isoform X3 [Mercenaria mercenaria]|uniref:uncharacterized protein LOC123566549 isoform X3 n=1 Tax=Mercenaria mercenaria TaxID=6596 RepID=UPI00234EC39A|nr:uncharacterized protein LOC123566549 isoform X3 [Mercenaria mercenaria]